MSQRLADFHRVLVLEALVLVLGRLPVRLHRPEGGRWET